MVLIEPLNEALFVFWIFGCISVLADMDHIWFRLGRVAPVNVSHWPGRTLHHPIIYFVLSIVLGIFVLPFVYGYYVQISGQIGALGTLLAESGLIVMTIIGLKWFDRKTKGFLNEKKKRKEEEEP